MDKLELTRMIRFGIEQLSPQNGHHDFEHLCRFLAKARIASNVYPATGPVSAGGDEGRDFQTFVTHIAKELGPNGGFAGLASEKRLAFACTLQKDELPTKIRGDVAKIVAGGPPADQIYVMLGADLDVAKVNTLKKEVREKHRIELEILDGQAIAELLSEHDTFWIAARWLAVPSSFSPDPPEAELKEPEWYIDARQRWRKAEHTLASMGDLIEVRSGLRRAVFERHARPDLRFWQELMEAATAEQIPPRVRQRARYEVAFAQLRGGKNLRPADHHVRNHLAELDLERASWAEMLDASVLLSYASGAVTKGLTEIDSNYVLAENLRLRKAIENRLKDEALTNSERAGLLDVLGNLRLQIDLEGLVLPEVPVEPPDPIEDAEIEEKVEPPANVPLVDIDGAIEAWTEFAELAPEAPMIPVDSVSRIVGFMTPVLVDHPGFRRLVELLDSLQAKVGGNAAAAARSRDRAMALVKAERPLEALIDLHEAKVRWWQGDTVRGSLLALMLLARCYEQLGLLMAARQQSLVAIGLAHAHGDEDDVDIIARGLMNIAHLDYRMGAWCSAAESYNVALLAHIQYIDDPWNPERHEDLQAAYLHGIYLRLCAELLGPATAEAVRASQDEFGLSEILDELDEEAEQQSADKWRQEFARLEIVPYADAGEERLIKWSALGITWEVSATNTYSHCRAAERFGAAAQILCAELAQEDLLLLQTTIRVRIQATDPERTRGRDRIRSEPGNTGSDWIVDLIPLTGDGSELDPDEIASELTGAIAAVLFEAALVSWDDYAEVLERCFKRGLGHKISAGRPYDDIAGVVTRDHFERIGRRSIQLPDEWNESPLPKPRDELGARTDPGPGYSEERSQEMIANRYKRAEELLCQTLPRLAADEDFQATYRRLQAMGWKDWHVLLALLNARINFRTEQMGLTLAEAEEHLRENPQHPVESPEEPPLPPQWLSVERLSEMRRFAFMSGLSNWGLEIHQATPDLKAIEELLGKRYGYWTDDVAHRPLLEEDQ